ncbi:DNA polymerase IV [candidate division FCPU426 bacterium]|nr:DNA polymerase IV [candidate division FCPU426 bacterium]
MPRIVFHLDLDTFFVSVERLLDPSLVGKPVVVSPGTARSVVAAASYEARVFGVHSAMPFAKAQRLCPQAVVCPGNFAAYAGYSRAFFDILDDYSPALEPASLDEGYLDYTGCHRLFGPPLAAAAAIQTRVKEELGLDVSVGISASKVVAKIASDLAKPAGILYALPGQEAALLAPLPIRRLPGVGPKTEPRLMRLGIRTIGDLAKLPRELAGQLLGTAGYWLQDAAQGRDDSMVSGREQAKSISHEETFMIDTTDPAFLRHALHRLACEVGYRLRKHGLKSSTTCVKVRYADFSLHTCSQTLTQPTDLDRVLFASGTALLQKVLTRRVRIRLLGFSARNLTAEKAQGLLLDLEGKERLENLHTAADRIRQRYGYDTVRWASLLRQDTE